MSELFKRNRPLARAGTMIALLSATVISGCASMHRDHVTVGSVPQDYRTNHPISLTEREVTLDLVAQSGDLTKGEINTLEGFMQNYDGSSGETVRLMVPAGSANEAAAKRKASALSSALVKFGVSRGAIISVPYGVADASSVAPVRVAYTTLKAVTNACGRWPEDLGETSENRNYANFGCSYQQNLAAQVANPTDLLHPRKTTSIDPERRGTAIDDWQAGDSTFDQTITY